MAIWSYDYNRLSNQHSDPSSEVMSLWMQVKHTKTCPFCSEPLETIREEMSSNVDLFNAFNNITLHGSPHKRDIFSLLKFDSYGQVFETYVKVCQYCGWWITFQNVIFDQTTLKTYAGVAGLKTLDLADVTNPITEVRDYLTAKYDARFQINPRVFEETVASVFKDLGYTVRVTAYSGDDGIDVILDGTADSVIGIQVKRYRDLIKVDQIRELTGALVINGITKGLFITTSDFQSGARRTAEKSGANGYPIELYNAERFYEALKISQRNRYNKFESPGIHPQLELVAEFFADGKRKDVMDY